MRLRWRRRNRRKRCRGHEEARAARAARSRESRCGSARRGAGGEEHAGGPRCVRGCGPPSAPARRRAPRSEEHTSELQSHVNLVCRLLLEKKKTPEKTSLTHRTRTTKNT